MKIECFIILILNSLLYIFFFLYYQYKKKTFDLGSILLLTWIVGSCGATYYYTFEVAYLSYDNITILPLCFLFFINCLLFRPFLKKNYSAVQKIDIYNLGRLFNVFSICFSILAIPPLLAAIAKTASFSIVSSALADMYAADEDRASLIFPSTIKPFYSILRHFSIFIIFLFFFQLTRKKVNILIVIGLSCNILLFLLVSFLSGSRGGIVSQLIVCAYFLFFMKHMIRPQILKFILRFTYILCAGLILGISAISISRLSGLESQTGRSQLMDQWISQYAGEGIIQYDHIAWDTERHLHGTQNLPYFYSYIDKNIKDLDSYTNKADGIVGTPVWVFYTYLGDLILDFGIIGSFIAALLIYTIIKFLLRTRRGTISFYHLIILCYFYEYLTIGFTANLFRTYYSQLQIIETLFLLGFIYIFQILNMKRHELSRNSNTGI